jgi:hypothetical protein
VIRTKDRGIAVLAYARAPGLHSRGEPATESNGWAARIELGAGVEVRGVVTDADGRPVAGAEVRLVPRDRAAHGLRSSDPRAWAAPGVFEHYVASVTADADGRYVIRGVPLAREGRTAVRHLPIARDAAGAWWAGEALWARSEAETVVRDLRLGAEAYVAEPAPNRMSVHVGGTVVVAEEEGTPVPDASVALVVAVRGDFEADGDRTAEDGSFDVSLSWEGSLAEDDPVLVVRAEGFRTQRVPAAAPEAGDKLVVALVKDVRGEARGAIRGRATDEGASVAGRLRIRCESEWGEQRDVMVVADTQGKFRLAGLEPGWWRLSAGWPDRTPVLVRAGEETDAVVRAVRWESDPRPWTDDDEVAWRQAERDFFETMRQRASEEGEGGTPEEQRARHDEAFARMHELGESRARRIARRAVRVRGLVASGPAWLTARSHSSTSQETWIAEVSSAEAYFPALAVGAWSFDLTCRDGAPDWFRMKVPAEGKGAKGELVLDAARAER